MKSFSLIAMLLFAAVVMISPASAGLIGVYATPATQLSIADSSQPGANHAAGLLFARDQRIDSGTVLAACDSCHSSIKPDDRSSGIGEGIITSKKKKVGLGGYKSIPETSKAPFETGWHNSYSA